MQERPRLRTIELSGGSHLVRRIALGALPVFAVIGALGYVMPAHRVYDESFHSNFADGGPASLLVFAGVALCTYLLRNRRFGAGIAAGAISMLGAVLALAPVFLVHMFSHVDQGPGEIVFAIGELGLFFLGAVVMVIEPILYLVERRKLVRAAMPAELPVARVFT